jgi:hypothetical protein
MLAMALPKLDREQERTLALFSSSSIKITALRSFLSGVNREARQRLVIPSAAVGFRASSSKRAASPPPPSDGRNPS